MGSKSQKVILWYRLVRTVNIKTQDSKSLHLRFINLKWYFKTISWNETGVLLDLMMCLAAWACCGTALTGIGDGTKYQDKRLGWQKAQLRSPRLRPHKKAHRPAEKYQQRQLEQSARKTERVRESYVGRWYWGEGREKGNSRGLGYPI